MLRELFQEDGAGFTRHVWGERARERGTRHARLKGLPLMVRIECRQQVLHQSVGGSRRQTDGRGESQDFLLLDQSVERRLHRRTTVSGLACELCHRRSLESGAGDAHLQGVGELASGETFEIALEPGVPASTVGRHDIENDPAAKRRTDARVPREAAEHESIAGQQREWRAADVDPREGTIAGRNGVFSDRGDAGTALGRSAEQLDRGRYCEGTGRQLFYE